MLATAPAAPLAASGAKGVGARPAPIWLSASLAPVLSWIRPAVKGAGAGVAANGGGGGAGSGIEPIIGTVMNRFTGRTVAPVGAAGGTSAGAAGGAVTGAAAIGAGAGGSPPAAEATPADTNAMPAETASAMLKRVAVEPRERSSMMSLRRCCVPMTGKTTRNHSGYGLAQINFSSIGVGSSRRRGAAEGPGPRTPESQPAPARRCRGTWGQSPGQPAAGAGRTHSR